MKIIFLNGPPNSGKDQAAKYIAEFLKNTRHEKFSKELKERCHGAFFLWNHDGVCDHDRWESVKDEPLSDFDGMTPRQAYIAFSENFVKPTFGDDALGQWLVKDLRKDRRETVTALISDSGFAGEAQVLVDEFGAENCTLVRIHREGYTFDNDSRGYISLDGVRTLDVTNVGNRGFLTTLQRVIL